MRHFEDSDYDRHEKAIDYDEIIRKRHLKKYEYKHITFVDDVELNEIGSNGWLVVSKIIVVPTDEESLTIKYSALFVKEFLDDRK